MLVKIRVGIASLGVAATAARLKFALMWGGLTLGLSLAIPFIINNWRKIVDTFDLSGTLIASIWNNVIDNIMYRWESFAAAFERTWMNLKARFGMDPGEPTQRVRKKPKGILEHAGEEMGHYGRGIKYIWSDEYDPGAKQPQAPDLTGGEGGGSGDGSGDGPRPGGGGDPDAEAEEAERRRQEEIEASNERNRLITEGFLQGMQRQRKARYEAAKQTEENAKKEMTWMERLKKADRTGLLERTGYWKKFHEFKAKMDKLAAIRELLTALASQPARAFSQTYANLGWPLGAIMGIVAQVATYAQIFAGLSSIRGMRKGGVAMGGVPGLDSIPTLLTQKEIVTPPENYDEHIDAVANARDTDLAAGERDVIVIHNYTELDGQVLSESVTEHQKRNRVF